jgi:plastocyanin
MNAKSLCAVAAAIALGLGACGDDDDEESAGTGAATGTQEEQPAPPEGPVSQTVALTETEFKIDPAAVEVDEAGVVEFKVENAGSVTHALEVESEDLEEETEDIAPGESATLKVELERGTYELYCPIGDHEEQGMTGELTVGGGGGASGSGDDDSGGAEAPSADDDAGY